jgi:hypothetical protein
MNPPAVERRKVVMQVVVGFVKPSSRSFGVVLASPNDIIGNDLLTDGQPNGRLRNFFTSSFDTTEKIADAFLAAGGSLILRTRSGKGPKAVGWVIKDGLPALSLSGASKGAKVEVKVLIEEATWQ